MGKVKALKPGDTIGIAAPSSPFDRTKFTKGVRVIERLGFRVNYRSDIFDQNRYLAGTDKRRADEFTELVKARDVQAVMFARGGYGSQRILPLLDAKILASHQKPVIGFSDLTALLTYLRQNCGFPTFYGPVLTELGGAKTSAAAEFLLRALTLKDALGSVSSRGVKTIKKGKASGPIVGGCLSLIVSSMGTPYELKTDGTILFIEEINEKVYALDRMLTQLKNSGTLKNVRGIIFGAIVSPPNEPYDVESMVKDVLADFGGPVLFGFPAGHTEDFVTLPMGAEVEIVAGGDFEPTVNYKTGLLS